MMSGNKKVKTTTAVHSDIGKVRKANEDSYFVSRDENLVLVCDGMGGQVAGGLASKLAVETIKDVYLELDDEVVNGFLYDSELELARSSRRLVAAVRLANRRIYHVSKRFPKLRGMGTTVVALTLDNSFATMVHVGDSRIFRHSAGKVLQLTEDHSWLNELIEDEEINEEQVETFAQKNVITRALGTAPTVKIDIHCEKYKKDDVYILCTDGMHNSVGPRDIRKTIKHSNGSIDAVTHGLIEKALRRDGSDNVTVAVARVDQDSAQTSFPAVSTTIPEEGEKIAARSDCFIQENYTEPNIQNSRIRMKSATSSFSIKMPLLILLTGLICFLTGAIVQRGRTRPLATPAQPTMAASADALPGIGTGNLAQEVIRKSPVAGDAVLAVVFFNSEKDFRRANLDKRGQVIDQLRPYSGGSQHSIDGDFSIFLIDANNNVIKKTSGIQIPTPER